MDLKKILILSEAVGAGHEQAVQALVRQVHLAVLPTGPPFAFGLFCYIIIFTGKNVIKLYF